MSATTIKNVSAAKRAQMEEMLRGLLAKTKEGSGSTVEEAAAAAEKAQAIAFKYGLDLLAAAEGPKAPAIVINGKRITFTYHDSWLKILMDGIARGNMCRIVSHSNSKDVTVVGAQHNIEFCESLHAYLLGEIFRLAGLAYNAIPKAERGSRTTFVNRFALGAAGVLRERLVAMGATMRAETANANALITVHESAVNAVFAEMFPKMKSGRRVSVGGGDGAFGRGVMAGKTMELQKSVAGGGTGSKVAGLLA